MTYTTAEAREGMLDDIAGEIDRLAGALASLEAAYELLDEHSQDRLEEQLFRPVQRAYGRLQRTYTEFGARTGIETRTFTPGSPGAQSQSARDLIERTVDAGREVDAAIAEVQDSLLPIEVGDPELRAGLSEVRATLAGVPDSARELIRVLGR
jgi:hypothetical protein